MSPHKIMGVVMLLRKRSRSSIKSSKSIDWGAYILTIVIVLWLMLI